ncbi:MAG TPA: Nramp family divalent metal transporter [Acidimicrobiales bacterium]|jgi:NRAMP (natural resistance-associated macrophage protein)-like metal ion transporter|nr:Nramp family divalent metal transporter [Acidimicrobiales bacterium]
MTPPKVDSGDQPAAAVELSPAEERHRRWRRIIGVAAILGPGLVAANAGNDAGGIATYASAGAQYGYQTLFIMVIVAIALAVVQEMAARLGAFTGEGLVSLIREQFPLRAATFAVVALVVANIGLVVSEFAGIGAAFELFGVSRYLTVPVAAVVIWALVVFGSYRYAERLFLLLSLAFVAYLVAPFLAHPQWGAVARHAAWPHFTGSKDFMLLAIALVGTSITPYMQLYQAAAVADRGIGPDNYPMERIDSVVGAIFASIVAMAIIVATAAAIGGTGPLASAKDAAAALKPVAGSAATTLFGIGLLGASALAAAVVPLSTAYAVSEAVGVERSVSRSFREAPFFVGFFTLQVVIGAGVALAPGNLIRLLINTQILNGFIAPIILVFLLILTNRTSVLGDAANGRAIRVVATVVTVLVAGLAAVVAVRSVLGWFGVAA